MATASLEGFAKGLVNREYPFTDRGIPALSSFYFGYGVGGPPVDNHLQYIMALPGGVSTDLTPNADLAPSTIPPGRAELLFRDDDPTSDKDEYFYRLSHAVFDSGNARRFQLRDVGGTGTINQPLPAGIFGRRPVITATPSILALAGFKIFFTGNRDHHIDQLGVMLEDDNSITIAMNDRNDDDVFAYLVDIVRISGGGMNIIPGEASGNGRGGARIEVPRIPQTSFVLRGFHFDFASSDHHLREVGVLRQGDRREVFFGDKNGDDAFTWKVRWAQVGAQVLSPG